RQQNRRRARQHRLRATRSSALRETVCPAFVDRNAVQRYIQRFGQDQGEARQVPLPAALGADVQAHSLVGPKGDPCRLARLALLLLQACKREAAVRFHEIGDSDASQLAAATTAPLALMETLIARNSQGKL